MNRVREVLGWFAVVVDWVFPPSAEVQAAVARCQEEWDIGMGDMTKASTEIQAVLLMEAVQARRQAATLRVAATRIVSDAVSAALASGVPRSKLAAALGVSVGRLYQLRDGK